MPIDFPQTRVVTLQELAARIFEKRKPGSDHKSLGRDLMRGFFDVCTSAGLDRVLADLAAANPPLDVSERITLEEHEPLFNALVHQIEIANPDGGGPRNAKAPQLANCLVVALGLAPVEEPDTRITLDGTVRAEVATAIAAALEQELAVPKVRETIVADARRRLDEHHHSSFAKIVANLDDRGVKMVKLPKVPLDAQAAADRALLDARNALIARVGGIAIDRAKAIIGKVSDEAAARIDQPVTLRATPRELAILRASQVHLAPSNVAASLLDGLTELARIAWRLPEKPVHTYAASKTFNIGDLIEHPKFGRGTVVSMLMQRIDVEFPEGKYTLVHVPPRR
jgi:hypothetical protein